MSTTLLLIQLLNGLQFGVLLFLIAAGLTLVFGVMGFINLAHGVQYMIGAYLTVAFAELTGNFFGALALALPTALLLGLALEFLIFRHLYDRDHLDQVLATFGVILFVNEAVKVIWGPSPLIVELPEALSATFQITEGLLYPVYRIVLIGVGLVVAAILWLVVQRTRVGMLIRAGATNPEIVSALGVDIRRLFTIVFGFGAMLAGFAGALAAPIFSVEPNMGDDLLIVAFVVIIIGGIGSIRGAFIAAVLVGLVDTLGRSVVTDAMRLVFDASAANQIGPALASMLVYVFMAGVLFFRPTGLFPARGSA
ncbi:MAG: branched-chain amino acid ABC transporter permease [Pseudomonadota bacterium]